jgi:hypothetical protein
MKRFICFLIGHRVRVGLWGAPASRIIKWSRHVDCSRCGETLLWQTSNSARKPLDVA